MRQKNVINKLLMDLLINLFISFFDLFEKVLSFIYSNMLLCAQKKNTRENMRQTGKWRIKCFESYFIVYLIVFALLFYLGRSLLLAAKRETFYN